MTKHKKLKRHPLSAIWPDFDHADLSADMAKRGQDEAILLYQGDILDGWHRYQSAITEGKTPKFKEFKGTMLEAAERVHAANNLRRHMTADQRYACFSQLCKEVPEFEAKYEALKNKGKDQKEAGRPLATDSQRVNVIEAKAADAGVSPATAKKVERVAKNDPKAVERIAKGETSANKELKKQKEKQPPTDKAAPSITDNPPKVERPKIADLVGIVHRGLGMAEEADQLSLKSNAVFFVVNGYRVKVTCQII